MEGKSRQTPLHAWHLSHGATMGDFGGYDMPLWYPAGPKEEHLAVILKAGIFDTSHMAGIAVKGPGAGNLLQRCFSKNLETCIGPAKKPLCPGRCVYGVFLNGSGSVIDDALVYMNAPGVYTVIVNAGMGGTVSAHLEAQRRGESVQIEDLTDRLGKIDVQGPKAAKIVATLIQNPDRVFDPMPYFSFKGDFNSDSPGAGEVRLTDGTPVLLSRTGYTGEFGFEIFVKAAHTLSLWERLIEAGKAQGALPCGLASRDSLRAGAVLPLSHQDIGDWLFVNHPWPFALPYREGGEGFTKDFLGADALADSENQPFTHAFVGFDPRKVIPGEDVAVLDEALEPIGIVLTCATDMAIDRFDDRVYSIADPDRPAEIKFRGLCCGFVKTRNRLNSGQIVFLQAGKRRLKVEIVEDVRPNRTARLAMGKMR
ncbi:MAG: aminomethyltransferase family protein [bacterium]